MAFVNLLEIIVDFIETTLEGVLELSKDD